MAVEVTVIQSTAIEASFWQEFVAMMPNWFQQGGIIMWLLLLLSFLITIISLERTFSWLSYKLKKDEHFLLNDCFAALNKKDKKQALILCRNLDTPALNMLMYGINSLPFSPEEKMESYATEQVNIMSQGQSFLRTAGVVALMLGFLGSILGLISSFGILSQQANITLNTVLITISYSFIPSASGVVIALLAFIPYRAFQSQTDKLNRHLTKTRSEFNYVCQQKALVTNHMTEIMELQEKRIHSIQGATETVEEQSEMPYHYEFKDGSDEVNVSLHKEMKNLHKTSQSSLLDMYDDKLKNTDDTQQPSLAEVYNSAVDEEQEFYGVNEVALQEQQEQAHLKKADK